MKKTLGYSLKFIFALLLITFVGGAQAQETQIKIANIRSAKGKILISVFKDNDSFDKEQAYQKFVFDKKDLLNGNLTVTVKIEPGIVGLALLDDENDNGKMDKNFIRMPKEGFGFSNFFLEKLKKPVFDDFKITVKPGLNKVNMKVKYI